MEDALLEFLQDEIMSGKRADSSFKSKTWQDAVAVVNANLPDLWIPLTAKKIQQKWENLKKNYDIYYSLTSPSGGGWDVESQTTQLDEKTWDEYLASHPKASRFKEKGLRNATLIGGVVQETRATEEFAFTVRGQKRKAKETAESSQPERDSQESSPPSPTPQGRASTPDDMRKAIEGFSVQPVQVEANPAQKRRKKTSPIASLAQEIAALRALADEKEKPSECERWNAITVSTVLRAVI